MSSSTPESSAGDDSRSALSSSDGLFGTGEIESKLESEYSLLYNVKRLVEVCFVCCFAIQEQWDGFWLLFLKNGCM